MFIESAFYFLGAVLISLFQAVSCFSAGALLLRKREYMAKTSPMFFVFRADAALCFTLGLCIFAMTYLLLALSSIFYIPVVIAVNVFVSSIFFLRFRNEFNLGSIRFTLTKIFLPLGENLFFKLIFIISVFLFVTSLPRTLIQPLTGDALVYYYAQAKLIAYLHAYASINTYQDIMGSVIPFIFEMMFSAFYLCGGAVIGQYASKLLVFVCFMFLLNLVFNLIKELRVSKEYAIFAVLILITSSSIVISLSAGKADIPSLLASCAAIYMVTRLKPEIPERFNMSLVAFLTAVASMGKFPYLSQLPVVVLCVYLGKRYRILRYIGKEVFYAAGIFLVTLLIGWNLKNYLAGGEPLAPLIDVAGYSPLRAVLNPPEVTNHILRIFPLAIIYGKFLMQEGSMSPLLSSGYIFFLASILLRGKVQYSGSLLGILTGTALGLIIWLSINPSLFTPRFMYPLMLGIIVSAGPAFDFIWQRKDLILCKTTLVFFAIAVGGMNFVMLKQYSTEYLIKNPLHFEYPLGFTQAAALVNKDMRPDVKLRLVTSFFEPFDGRFLNSFKVLHQDEALIPRGSIGILTASEFWENIKKENIDYIYIWNEYYLYPEIKYLFNLEKLPSGLQVETIKWADASLIIIRRSKN